MRLIHPEFRGNMRDCKKIKAFRRAISITAAALFLSLTAAFSACAVPQDPEQSEEPIVNVPTENVTAYVPATPPDPQETLTASPFDTSTPYITQIPTDTETFCISPSGAVSPSATPSPSPTPTKGPTATHSPTQRPTATRVPTKPPTPSPTPTPVPTPTARPEDMNLYPGQPELLITEVMASNNEYPDADGNYYDFVELYNNSSSPILLSRYFLSDKAGKLQKYHLPAITLGPGRFIVIYCTGESDGTGAPFKINSSGEKLFLSNINRIVDTVEVPDDLRKNESYGRNSDGFVYMRNATPGKANAAGYMYTLTSPTADVPTGAYDSPFELKLSGEGTIYYTTDGTEPTTSSKKYTGPIHIDNIVSIRAASINGTNRSRETSFFYIVGIEHTLPIVNVAIRQEYLTGSEGVLNHIEPEYEHVSYVTLMEGGKEVFSAPCGFKLHGNDSKKGEKQNFQLRFRSQYGLSKLNCKLFDNRDTDVFNSLLLKGGSEDYIYCGFRDELCTTLIDGYTDLDVLACRPVILYLNGQYHGIYFLRERYDQDHFAQKLGGVSEESVNVLRAYGMVEDGDKTKYSELLSYCRSHDMTKPESLAYVTERVDINSLIDWYVCRSYMGDGDLTNVRFYQSDEADGKWRWCYFDLDWAFWTDRVDSINNVIVNGPNSTLMKRLFLNPMFRDMFLKRYAELMGTVLNERVIMERIDWFVAMMEPEIAENQARYGLTVEGWYEWIEKMRFVIRDGRRNVTVLKDIKAYFNLSDAEMDAYFGSLGYDLDREFDPTPTATPEPTPTEPVNETPTPTQIPEGTPTAMPTTIPEPTPSDTPADTPTAEVTPTAESTPTEAPSATPEDTASPATETPAPTEPSPAPTDTPAPAETFAPDHTDENN